MDVEAAIVTLAVLLALVGGWLVGMAGRDDK
jgi:hypothetical protein